MGVVLASPVPAGAQGGADGRFAPVLVTGAPPPLAVSAIRVGTGPGGPAGTVAVTVAFQAPVILPPADYRLAVVVGEPTGTRVRASLVVDGSDPRGEVDRAGPDPAPVQEEATTMPATAWVPAGPTRAELAADGTSVSIDVPVDGLADPAALWVEADLGPAFAVTRVTTPFVDLGALTGRAAGPALAANPWVSVPPAGEGATVGVRTAGSPVVALRDGVLEVTALDVLPAELVGQPVTEASDLVRILAGDGGRQEGFAVIDRLQGTVQLFDTGEGTEVEVRGDWLITGPGADPVAPTAVALGWDAVLVALGVTPDGSQVVTADRLYTLVDGRQAGATGVAAPQSWFAAQADAPAAPPAAPGSEPASGTGGASRGVAVAVGIGAGVALGVVVSVVVTRRRRPPPGGTGRAGGPATGRSPADVLAALEAEVRAS